MTDTYLTFDIKGDIRPSLVFKKDGYHDEIREVNPYSILVQLRAVEPKHKGNEEERPPAQPAPAPAHLSSPPRRRRPRMPTEPPPLAPEGTRGSPIHRAADRHPAALAPRRDHRHRRADRERPRLSDAPDCPGARTPGRKRQPDPEIRLANPF
jgi:hypothetical protein